MPLIAALLITDDPWASLGFRGKKVFVYHNAEFVPESPYPKVAVSGAWDWGALVGLALRHISEEYVWIQHDDAECDPDVPNTVLAEAIAKGAVLAFPNVSGPDASWQQRIESKGVSDCFSYSSDCAFLIRRDFLSRWLRVGMPGKGFHAGYFQLCARKELAATIVVHSASVTHRYAATWGRLEPDKVRQMIFESVRWASVELGIARDGWERIAEPAPVWHTDAAERPVAGGGEIFYPLALKRVKYEGDVLEAIANTCPSDEWIWYGEKMKRCRLGDRYGIAGQPSDIAISLQPNIGMGDVVFVCKAVRAMAEAGYRVHATSQGGYGRLLAWCPDFASWGGAPETPNRTLEVGHIGNWGADCVPDHIAAHFGVAYKGQQARFDVPEANRREAAEVLRCGGWKGGRLLVCVPHGGWISKRWRHMKLFARQAAERGYEVWTPGKKWGTVDAQTPDFMSAVACLHFAHALVGYDSGLSHVAAALGKPVVCLSGPTNASRLIFEGSPDNVAAIEMRDPDAGHCAPHNCRARNGGATCPLKGGLPGAVCIDEIPTSLVWKELEELAGKIAAEDPNGKNSA